MARTGSFGGGTLSPFGGAATDFGAFNVGASSTVSTQEAASLAYSLAEAQHNNGLMTDQQFEAAQSAYLGGLDKTTATGQNAVYTMQMQQYTDSYNALVQAVQTGGATAQSLVEFNRQALNQTVSGSTEYSQRQDRLFSSEGQVFQADEAVMNDQLNLGKLTIVQAQDWYAAQVGQYGDNYAIQQDIGNKLDGLKTAAVRAADDAMVKAWNDGKVGIAQVVSYAAQAIAADPTGDRAKNLQTVIQQATLANVEAGAQYRYNLTSEYEQLALTVAAGNTGSLGSTSKTSSTRTFIDPTAPGGWRTVTTIGTKYNAPSAAQIAAKKQADLTIAAAKLRMKEIAKEIGTKEGGWFTDQNYVALLSQQQALLVANTPSWLALQAQINGHKQRIEQAKAVATSGVKVILPGVRSEFGGSALDVSATERGIGTGLSKTTLLQVQGWSTEIGDLKAKVAAGTLTDDQLAQANAQIATDQTYIANALKTAVAPAVTKPVAASGGGGGGSSAVAARASTAAATAVAKPVAVTAAKTREELQNRARAASNTAASNRVYYSLPPGTGPTEFDDFHSSMVKAVTTGAASFEDPDTGRQYALPTDPKMRLDVLTQLDAQNVNLKFHEYQTIAANPKSSQSALTHAHIAYNNAVGGQAQNRLWILDYPAAGSVVASADVYYGGVLVAKTDQIIAIADQDITADHDANILGYALSYFDVVKEQASKDFVLVDQAMARGDLTAAAMWTRTGQKLIDDLTVGPKLDGNGQPTSKGSVIDILYERARATADSLVAAGAVLEKSSAVAKDLDRLKGIVGGNEIVDVSAKGQDNAKILFGTPADNATGRQAMAGALALDSAGNLMKSLDKFGQEQVVFSPGAGLALNKDTKTISVKQGMAVTGHDANGRNTYSAPGEVQVLLKIGGVMTPVSATPEIGQVGSLSMGGAVMGNIVTYQGEQWMEDPTHPGVWLPFINGVAVTFTVPQDWKLGADIAGIGNIPNVPAGTPTYSWMGTDKNGTQVGYVTVQEGANFHVWSTGGPNGSWTDLGTGITASGDKDQNWANVMRGFGINRSNLTNDQRIVLNLVDVGVNKTGGAFIGATGSDMANLFTRPGVLQQIVTGPSSVAGNAWQVLMGAAAKVKSIANGPAYAPVTTPSPGSGAWNPAVAAMTASPGSGSWGQTGAYTSTTVTPYTPQKTSGVTPYIAAPVKVTAAQVAQSIAGRTAKLNSIPAPMRDSRLPVAVTPVIKAPPIDQLRLSTGGGQ